MGTTRKVVEKPWGAEEHLFVGEHYAIKYLFLNPKEEISLQYHQQKVETMMILEGVGELVVGGVDDLDAPLSISPIATGDIFTFQAKTIHQIKAFTPLKILEVSTPQLDDLVRIKDKYARVEKA